jgi:hypothetical protein
MGQRFQITESERKHIKGLYEQNEKNNEFTIDFENIRLNINNYTFEVYDDNYNKYLVDVKNFLVTNVESLSSNGDKVEQVKEFIEEKISNRSLEVRLPWMIKYNKSTGETKGIYVRG